jgi:endonuclease/exonuclease/phosphatase family metal-dependent hydrolase
MMKGGLTLNFRACIVSLLISVVFVFLAVPNASALNEIVPGRSIDLRLMTYNIHAGIGTDGKYDLERIADVIKNSKADVVGLQEVDVHWGARSNFDNEIKLLAERLDMNYFFAPIYDFEPGEEGGERRQFGVAVLSKYPIIKEKNREITRLSTQDPNPTPKPAPGFAEVKINAKGAQFTFYVTHLDYRSDPIVREMQVRDMINIFAETDGYKVLVGDMNATPDSEELNPLFSAFQDAWSTIHHLSGYTFPAINPAKRIDYIFTSEGIEVNDAEIVHTLASDHLPVIADVSLIRGKVK